ILISSNRWLSLPSSPPARKQICIRTEKFFTYGLDFSPGPKFPMGFSSICTNSDAPGSGVRRRVTGVTGRRWAIGAGSQCDDPGCDGSRLSHAGRVTLSLHSFSAGGSCHYLIAVHCAAAFAYAEAKIFLCDCPELNGGRQDTGHIDGDAITYS